jgi:transcriptional regulator with XRE-family HTH domain
MKDILKLRNIELDPRKLRPLRGNVSRAAIGESIGVGSSQVANYENGAKKPSADKLLRLMMLYNVRPEDLAVEVDA